MKKLNKVNAAERVALGFGGSKGSSNPCNICYTVSSAQGQYSDAYTLYWYY